MFAVGCPPFTLSVVALPSFWGGSLARTGSESWLSVHSCGAPEPSRGSLAANLAPAAPNGKEVCVGSPLGHMCVRCTSQEFPADARGESPKNALWICLRYLKEFAHLPEALPVVSQGMSRDWVRLCQGSPQQPPNIPCTTRPLPSISYDQAPRFQTTRQGCPNAFAPGIPRTSPNLTDVFLWIRGGGSPADVG